MKYIITADDYGVSDIIDDGIVRGIQEGVVTAVACFANGTKNGQFTMDKIKALHDQFPHVSIGMHFTINSGKALAGKSTLTRRDGYFWGKFGQEPKYINAQQLYLELTEQVNAFRTAGIPIAFFSDHFGFLTLSDKTMGQYIKVVKDYAALENRTVPVRNPIFLSYALKQDAKIKQSKMKNLASLGAIAKDIGSTLEKRLQKSAAQFQNAEIPTTLCFIEHLYKCPTSDNLLSVLQAVEDQIKSDYKTKYSHLIQTGNGEQIGELVAHLGEPLNFPGRQSHYRAALKLAKAHGGISPAYISKGRFKELDILIKHKETLSGKLTTWTG